MGAVRAVWTAPTTMAGHAIARLAGCGRPQRIGGPAARAWLYRLPEGRLKGFGAIAVGHAIIVEPELLARRGVWLLAHELAHTCQHDWLGPFYLPLHGLLQVLSAVIYFILGGGPYSPVHAYNPLERLFICVPVDIMDGPVPHGEAARRVLLAFGLTIRPVN
jgi:hypothetical protein